MTFLTDIPVIQNNGVSDTFSGHTSQYVEYVYTGRLAVVNFAH